MVSEYSGGIVNTDGHLKYSYSAVGDEFDLARVHDGYMVILKTDLCAPLICIVALFLIRTKIVFKTTF